MLPELLVHRLYGRLLWTRGVLGLRVRRLVVWLLEDNVLGAGDRLQVVELVG
jgi:hypothetical protein